MQPKFPDRKKIFFSYCWSEKKEADYIYASLKHPTIDILKDSEVIYFTGSISKFMLKIKSADFVLMLLSEAYLTSEDCMYEAILAAKSSRFRKKILPISLLKGNIRSAETKRTYCSYWKKKLSEAKRDLKDYTDQGNLTRIGKLNMILDHLGDFFTIISDVCYMSLGQFEQKGIDEIFTIVEFGLKQDECELLHLSDAIVGFRIEPYITQGGVFQLSFSKISYDETGLVYYGGNYDVDGLCRGWFMSRLSHFSKSSGDFEYVNTGDITHFVKGIINITVSADQDKKLIHSVVCIDHVKKEETKFISLRANHDEMNVFFNDDEYARMRLIERYRQEYYPHLLNLNAKRYA